MKGFKLINKITEFHPSMGIEQGLSTYTGGMADTGHWFEGRLLAMKKKELRALLSSLQEQDKPSGNPAEKYTGEVVHLNNGMWYYEQERRAREEFERRLEVYWLNLK